MEHNQNLTARLREAGITYQEGEPLASHTTFKIGGPAAVFVQPDGEAQLCQAVRLCRQLAVPCYLLGNGSNVLFGDRGYAGAVISTAGMKGEVSWQGDTLTAPAGMPLGVLCMAALHAGLTGLEFAYGIPGTVGGAVYMNAGAYGGEMKDVVERVRHLTPAGEEGEAAGEALQFAYRKSRYTGGRDIITFVEYRLAPGDPAQISAQMEDLMARRKSKQPYDMPSAGSVFKRPEGYYAAALIEECGLKGRRVGGAQVSEKHAGFIVNTGGATCQDVLRLIGEIQREVFAQKGVRLETEVRVTGEA